METKFTLNDEFEMEGAITILIRYARHLKKHVSQVVQNYEATDFDKKQFLTDVKFALDNADVVKAAAETITKMLNKMRAEVAPTNNKPKEDEK